MTNSNDDGPLRHSLRWPETVTTLARLTACRRIGVLNRGPDSRGATGEAAPSC
ncbi:hypothetical protein ACVWXM_002293 [Bradyrhizobium sp. GM7.3]|jgi:hypothetical protein